LDPNNAPAGIITGIADMAQTNGQKSVKGEGPPPGQGPPAESRGMWISTNSPIWHLEPGEFDKTTHKPKSFKITIEGPSGKTGFFRWYWPKALLDFMNMKVSDLAGFIDNDQVSVNTTEYADGGGLVSLNLSYSEHVIKTAKALPISLAASKKSLKKKGKVNLYGWLGSKKAKKVVEVYRKIKGQKKYSKIGKVKTGAKGYYKRSIPVAKTASFYTRTKSGSKWLKSPVKSVSVKK